VKNRKRKLSNPSAEEGNRKKKLLREEAVEGKNRQKMSNRPSPGEHVPFSFSEKKDGDLFPL